MNDTCCLITCVNSSSLVILPIQRSTVKVVNFLTKDENLCSSLKRASSARRKRRPIGRRHHNDDDNDDYEENISKRDKRVGDGRMRVEVQSKTLEPQIWCFHNNEPRFGSGWLRFDPCVPPANEHQKERSWWRPYNTRERLSQARPMNSEIQGTDRRWESGTRHGEAEFVQFQTSTTHAHHHRHRLQHDREHNNRAMSDRVEK